MLHQPSSSDLALDLESSSGQEIELKSFLPSETSLFTLLNYNLPCYISSTPEIVQIRHFVDDWSCYSQQTAWKISREHRSIRLSKQTRSMATERREGKIPRGENLEATRSAEISRKPHKNPSVQNRRNDVVFHLHEIGGKKGGDLKLYSRANSNVAICGAFFQISSTLCIESMVKREINSEKLGPLQLQLESPTCVNYSKSAAFLPPSGPYQTTKTINASIIYPFETKIVPFLKILPISWKAIVNQAAGITVNRPLIPLFIDSYSLFYATDHYLSALATTLYHVTIAFFRKNTRVKSYRQNQLIGPSEYLIRSFVNTNASV